MTISKLQFEEMQRRVSPRSPVECVADAGRESALHARISAECRKRGWLFFHGSMAHRAMRTIGEPDYTILADHGRVYFIEAKSKGCKLTPQQIGLAMIAEKLGHKIHCVRSLKEFLTIVDPQPTPPERHCE